MATKEGHGAQNYFCVFERTTWGDPGSQKAQDLQFFSDFNEIYMVIYEDYGAQNYLCFFSPDHPRPGSPGPPKAQAYNFCLTLMNFIWQFKKTMTHKITSAFFEPTP